MWCEFKVIISMFCMYLTNLSIRSSMQDKVNDFLAEYSRFCMHSTQTFAMNNNNNKMK